MDLIHLKEKSEEKKRIENQLKKADKELVVEKEKFENLTIQLKKEFTDVQRLEEGGLTSMFYNLLGSKDKKLDKERQEYLAAKLKYDNCKNEIEKLETEIEKLKKQLSEIGTPEIEYKNLLNEKSDQLKTLGDEKFLKYDDLLSYYFSQKKEVNEAIAAGEKVLEGLHYATHALKKAKNWGTVDMIGGGLITTAIKHSNIDDAKEMIHGVQVFLRKFRRELTDINISELPDMNVQIDSFSTFADYFFDNLIFDWVVQSKINRSLDSCLKVKQQVSEIVERLKTADSNITQKYKNTKTEFTNYIVLK